MKEKSQGCPHLSARNYSPQLPTRSQSAPYESPVPPGQAGVLTTGSQEITRDGASDTTQAWGGGWFVRDFLKALTLGTWGAKDMMHIDHRPDADTLEQQRKHVNPPAMDAGTPQAHLRLIFPPQRLLVIGNKQASSRHHDHDCHQYCRRYQYHQGYGDHTIDMISVTSCSNAGL